MTSKDRRTDGARFDENQKRPDASCVRAFKETQVWTVAAALVKSLHVVAPMPAHTDLAVVGNALGARAGVLRDAEHALEAAGDAADHATHRTADHGADRAEHLATGVEAFLSAAGDALRVGRSAHRNEGECGGGEGHLHTCVTEEMAGGSSHDQVLSLVLR